MIPEVVMQAQQRLPPPGGFGGPMLAINLVAIGLLLALLTVFFSTWRKTKAPFMLGLVVFAAVLLLQDLVRVAHAMGLLTRPGVELIPELLELVALGVLLYLATR